METNSQPATHHETKSREPLTPTFPPIADHETSDVEMLDLGENHRPYEEQCIDNKHPNPRKRRNPTIHQSPAHYSDIGCWGCLNLKEELMETKGELSVAIKVTEEATAMTRELQEKIISLETSVTRKGNQMVEDTSRDQLLHQHFSDKIKNEATQKKSFDSGEASNSASRRLSRRFSSSKNLIPLKLNVLGSSTSSTRSPTPESPLSTGLPIRHMTAEGRDRDQSNSSRHEHGVNNALNPAHPPESERSYNQATTASENSSPGRFKQFRLKFSSKRSNKANQNDHDYFGSMLCPVQLEEANSDIQEVERDSGYAE
jgi:hypothetical protein